MYKFLDKIILFLALPFLLQIIVFYGFNSAYYPYSKLENLPDYYYESVYNYRFLSRDMLNFLFNKIHVFFEHKDANTQNFSLKYGTLFYHTLFLFNSIFLVLSSWSIFKIFNLKKFAKTDHKLKLIIHILLLCLVSLGNYVLTPYDNSAIFFFCLIIYFSIIYIDTKNLNHLVIISLLILIATFNRETSSLNIAFLAALMVSNKIVNKETLQKTFKTLILPVSAFLIAYIFVRVFLNNGAKTLAVNEGIYFVQNISKLNNIAGIFFFLIFIRIAYFLAISKENKTKISTFLLFSTPYLVMILFVGILWEIRLFVPIIFGMVFLSQMNFEKETK